MSIDVGNTQVFTIGPIVNPGYTGFGTPHDRDPSTIDAFLSRDSAEDRMEELDKGWAIKEWPSLKELAHFVHKELTGVKSINCLSNDGSEEFVVKDLYSP
ncbi:MAG: hypothetical protein KDA91_20990 [Planctomycetaceae bacterium]|nr:hypothetical protein [Planctomycetaceae bacterium]